MEIIDNVLIKVRNEDIVNGMFIIPKHITKINEFAFASTNLQKIEIPDNVVEIGKWAFSGCSKLKYVKLPDALKKIEPSTFQSCENLIEIILPKELIEIDRNAFSYCTNLKKVEINENLQCILSRAFKDCNELELKINTSFIMMEYEFAENIKKITIYGHDIDTNYLSWNNLNIFIKILSDIREQELKDKIYKKLSEYNLFNDMYLNDLGHNKLIKLVNNNMYHTFFSWDYDYAKVFNDYIEKYVNEHNVLNGVGDERIIDGTFIITKNIKTIDKNTFSNCKSLRTIEIPDNVVEIKEGAFSGCLNLEYVKLPKDLTEISDSMFDGCSNLNRIIFPNNVKRIGKFAFRNCNSLTEINLPNSVQSIDNLAFGNCLNLKIFKMSDNVVTISEHSFYNCPKLESVQISDKIETIEDNAFAECKELNLSFTTSLFQSSFYVRFIGVKCLYVNGINIKNQTNRMIDDELRLTREKELREKLEFELMKNNLFDKKYLNDKKHNEFISLVISRYKRKYINYYDYRKDLNRYIEEYIQKYVKNKNVMEITLIKDNPMENVLNYLNNYEVPNTVINNPNDIIFYGQELEDISMYITNVRYQITAKYSSEMINTKMKKMLKGLTTISDNFNIFTMLFNKKFDSDVTLNEDVIRQLRFYAKYKLEQEDEEVTLLEQLNEIIKVYITKVDGLINGLNDCKKNSLAVLINEKDRLELSNVINCKITDLQKNLVVMIEYYKEINSIIGNNLSYMIKLNDIRTVLLPAVVLEVTKNNGVLKKQESIETVDNIILMLEEIIQSDKNKLNNKFEEKLEIDENLDEEIKTIIGEEKVLKK